MYDPDRTYLDVDFTGTPGYANGFNQVPKDCGARFDWDKRLFYIPTNICPMAALCAFPAISYARHLSLQIVTYQRDQGMAPSLHQVDDHRGLVRPQRMIVPLVPFSRVRVVVGPGARDRVVRNRRTMSSVVIGMMTFMTCMVPAESSLSMTAHQHSASVFAAEVLPIAYLLLAAGALALTVFMLHHQERFRHRFESHEVFSLRLRLNCAPTAREIAAELQRLEVLRWTREHGYSPVSSPEYSPVSPAQSPPVEPVSDDEYVPGPNTFADRVNNPMPVPLQIELARGHAMSIVGPTIDVNDVIAAGVHRRDHVDTVPVPAPPSPATVARQFQPVAADGLAVIADMNTVDTAPAARRLAAMSAPAMCRRTAPALRPRRFMQVSAHAGLPHAATLPTQAA
jgi:hypothetical protein